MIIILKLYVIQANILIFIKEIVGIWSKEKEKS